MGSDVNFHFVRIFIPVRKFMLYIYVINLIMCLYIVDLILHVTRFRKTWRIDFARFITLRTVKNSYID